MSELFPRRTGRRGQCRSRFYPNECVVLDAVKLKSVLQRAALSTLIEFPGLRRSISLTRISESTILLQNCPPPIDTQEIELIDAPWGPKGALRRFLFGCPYCSKRVAKLFVPWSGSGFACRLCHGIVYPPRRDHLDTLLAEYGDLGRHLSKLVKLRATAKHHVVPPGTADQIEKHVGTLLREVESLRSKVRMHAGHVG